LDIEVSGELVEKWIGWFAPEVQPYVVPPDLARALGLADDRDRLTAELNDSFWLYDVESAAVVWLTKSETARFAHSACACWPLWLE
jgi:hypothetical protein